MKSITRRISRYNHYNNNSVEYIVMHDTGNYKDKAKDNANYFNGGDRGSSAHYFVDDTSIYQVVEDYHGAWHCGDGNGRYDITNTNSISVEMCNSGDYISETTIKNALELVKYLQNKYNVPNSKVVRHYDASRKICPNNMSANNWAKWKEFKRRLGNASTTTSNNNVNNREDEEKVKNIVAYGYGIDKNAAEYLADFLSCSTIELHRRYDYSNVENVYGVGGSKGNYTGYMDMLITGTDRYNTFERVIDYILTKKGVNASNSFTVSQEEKQAQNKLVIYNNYVDKRAAEYLAYKLDCPLKENRDVNVNKYDFVYHVGGGNTPSGVKVIKGQDRYLTAKAVIDFIKKL